MKKYLFCLILTIPFLTFAESRVLTLARSSSQQELDKVNNSQKYEQLLLYACYYEWDAQSIPYHCLNYINEYQQDKITFLDGHSILKKDVFERCLWAAQHKPQTYVYNMKSILPMSCQNTAEQFYKILMYKQKGHIFGMKNVN